MYYLNQIKAHSPLLRVIVWAVVIVYGVGQVRSMVETWADVTAARTRMITIEDCAEDAKCMGAILAWTQGGK